MTAGTVKGELAQTNQPPPAHFNRILVGIDDTPEAIEAARQAVALREDGGELHLLAVVETAKAAHAGFAAPPRAEQMLHSARVSLEDAGRATMPTSTSLVRGRPVPVLLERIRRQRITLLALGSHEHRRSAGLLAGAVGSVLLREAPCSVLFARSEGWPGGRPTQVVVGVDGSPESDLAARVAEYLAVRFAAELELVVGLGGKLKEPDEVVARHANTTVDRRPPVDALVAASERASLVVVGSRGLHGLPVLGSVSERVAHRARCSVLVVR